MKTTHEDSTRDGGCENNAMEALEAYKGSRIFEVEDTTNR